MLLQLNDPTHALKQFEATLRKEPRCLRPLYRAAHAAQSVGDRDTSKGYFRELLKVCADTDKPGRIELKETRKALASRKR